MLYLDPVRRRALLFFINIGVPLVVCMSIGKPQLALLSSIVGMTLGFADVEGDLPMRLGFLTIDGISIVITAAVGHILVGHVFALWIAFASLAFIGTIASRGGRELTLIGKQTVVAFSLAATLPAFSVGQIYCFLGAWLVNAVSRSVDQFLFGPLPILRSSPIEQPAHTRAWVRYASAFSFAALLALFLGTLVDREHRFWVVATTVFVMQPNKTATFRRVFDRVAGTALGTFAAFLIDAILPNSLEIVVINLLLAPLIPHHVAHRYWLHTALIALLILLSYSLTGLNQQGINTLLVDRMKDILLGAIVAIIGTVLAFSKVQERKQSTRLLKRGTVHKVR